MLRIGLIGYGGWARMAFAPALAADGRGEIVTVCVPSQASRDRAREELGPDVEIFAGFQELLDGAELDAVMMALPDNVHEEAMLAALDAGVGIYWEPPLAHSRERIRPLIYRLARAEQITHADLELGFAPAVSRMAELIRQGTVGHLQAVSIKLNSDWGQFPGPDLSLVHHLGPWYVDALNTVIGRPPSRVQVMDGFGQPGRRQHFSIAHFDYDGAWGTVQLNIESAEELYTRIEATGDAGEIVVDYFKSTVASRTRKERAWKTVEIAPRQPVIGGWPGELESVSAFLDAVESGRPSRTNGRALAQLHLIGLAAEASGESGSWEMIEVLD